MLCKVSYNNGQIETILDCNAILNDSILDGQIEKPYSEDMIGILETFNGFKMAVKWAIESISQKMFLDFDTDIRYKDIQSKSIITIDKEFAYLLAKTVEFQFYRKRDNYEFHVMLGAIIETKINELFLPPTYYGIPIKIEEDSNGFDVHRTSSSVPRTNPRPPGAIPGV